MTARIEEAFALLVDDTLRRTDRVAQGLRDLEAEYGGALEERSYRTFVDALQLAAQAIRVVLEKRAQRFALPGADKNGGYEAVKVIAEDLGGRLEEQLRLLRVQRADELEIFSVPMTRLAKQMVPNCELLFFPWAEDLYLVDVYNPTFAGGLNPRLEDDLVRAYGRDIKFLKLRFSTLRQLDVFQHTVFAHEVAHHVLDRSPPRVLTGRSARAGESVSNWLLAQRPLPPRLRRNRELEDWFVELSCDTIAMRVMGPAYLVAFAEVTAGNRALTAEAERRSHPPAALRYRILLEEGERFLDDRGGRWALPALRMAAAAHPELQDPVVPNGGEDWLREVLDELRQCLPTLHTEALYDPGVLRDDLGLVRSLAQHGVPPCERLVALEPPRPNRDPKQWSEALDWRSIINGVLFWHLTELAERPEPDRRKRGKLRDEAIGLTLGGIELSEFQRRALRLRDELGRMRLPEEWGVQ